MNTGRLLLSPHDDDSALFAAFTCLRDKPIVVIVTDSYIQPLRGELGCDAETRARESFEAHKILGCSLVRLGIRDDIVDERFIRDKLLKFQNFEVVYAPALQGGNPHHDMVSKVAKELFGGKVVFYTTYTKTEPYTIGKTEIKPTKEEMDLKNKALFHYRSQLGLSSTKDYFEAVKNKSEWFI